MGDLTKLKVLTKEQFDIFLERYPQEGASLELQKTLGKTADQMRKIAFRYGVRYLFAPILWTQEEDEILKDLYCRSYGSKEIAKTVGHTSKSVIHRTRKLGLQRERSSCFTGYREVSGTYVGVLRGAAKKRNIRFDITAFDIHNQFIRQEKKCFYSGRQISFVSKTASVDRTDSSMGYFVDNIKIVHVDVNTIKGSFTYEEFITIIHTINDWNFKDIL